MNTYLCRFLSPEQAITYKPNLSFWFNPVWMNGFSRLFNITPKVLTCFKNDNPVAYLPFYEKSFITIKKAFNPMMVYYCPIEFEYPERKNPNRNMLLNYDITKAMAEALWKNYKRVMLNIPPDIFDMRGFKESGFDAIPHYTFIKDLKQPEGFFIDEMTKLRKAQKNDYTFGKSFDPESIVNMVFKLYSRKKRAFPVDRNKLMDMLVTFNKAGLIEQYNVYKQDRVVSSMINIINNSSTLIAWTTASKEDDLRNGVSLLMFWNLFQTYSDKYEYYDLCGANTKGPARVKAGLGADLKLFFQIRKGY